MERIRRVCKLLAVTTGKCTKTFARNASAKIKTEEFQLYKLQEPPSATVEIDSEKALKMYREMQSLRRMENSIADLYKSRLVRGFCHLYNGQEAIATSIFNTRRAQDAIITSYRCHGFMYLMSKYDIYSVVSELMGHKEGCSHGKGGSMHIYTDHFYGGNGIVGAQVPLGTGIGLAQKYLNNNGVSFTLYGDGAANQGQVHEAFNLSKLWMLPVIFICENNLYGMGTSSIRSSADHEYYRRCEYISGLKANGMDLPSCMAACNYAIEWIMAGKGPILIEFETYRYFGHSMSDPGKSYRNREEIQEVRAKRDPIMLFTKKIVEGGLVKEDELKKIDKEVKIETKKIIEKAKQGSELGLEHLSYNIYKKNYQPYIRNVDHFKPLKHKDVPPPK